ncbi:MAG: 50S ribosomal protein L13 [Chitinophagales bacterium]|nr:50S ribosomal protein L13 [Chitinophagales bacterium]
MNTLSYRTQHARKEDVTRDWYVVDAEGQTLGRLVSRIATVLRGKHKASYTAHVDTGDYVIVLNSNKIHLSGNKWNDKKYITFSGYPGGQKITAAKDLNRKKPTAMIEQSVKGMLPKNRLGRQMFKKLFVYDGNEHPHTAQKPKELKLK